MKINTMSHLSIFVLLSSLSFNIYASQTLEAKKAAVAPVVDGVIDDVWNTAEWHGLDHHILGAVPSKDDFSGRFKILWDHNKLYLLAQIQDDVLFDGRANPLEAYWDDDCLEIFIDEDRSGGNHQFNFNAFAYHIALDNQVVDIGYKTKDGEADFMLLNEHLKSAWRRKSEEGHQVIWEVALDVYDNSFSYTTNEAQVKIFNQAKPVRLSENKSMGFMLAYCDNDGSENREHFMGSVPITPRDGDKNLGYIDASVFGELKLIIE